MADIWENVISILMGNLNSGRSYLTITVRVYVKAVKRKHDNLRDHERHGLLVPTPQYMNHESWIEMTDHV